MNNLVGQAERVARIVSEWFTGHQDAPTHTTHANAEDTHTTPSGAASYAASLVSSYWNTYVYGEKGNARSPPSSSFFSSSYSSLSSFRNQHQWLNDPLAALDSFLWNYTPDLRSLQHRLGLDENSMDMRIIALAMLLPLVLLLLVMVCSMGAGHTDENSHPGLQRHKVGPAVVSGKKETGKGPSKVKGSGSTSSKTLKGSQTQHKKSGGVQDNIGPVIPIEGNTLGSWLALLGSSGFTGAEKLAYKPIDITAAMKELEKESKALDQHHAERRNSWSSMMGAIGYAGGEMETHAPYKHLEGKHLGHLLGDAARAHESAVGVPEQRHAKESVADRTKEVDIIGPTAVQHEQDELGLDNQEQEEEDERLQRQEEEEMAARLIAFEEKSMAAAKIKTDTVKAKAPSKKDAKESTTHPTYAAKVKTPMPGAFVEAQANLAMGHGTRGKKQVPESDGGSSSRSKPTPLRTRTPLPESSRHKPVAESSSPLALAEGSIGSRLWNYAQNSPFIKNVDSLSGGLLGTAVATVAVLANTAKAATTLVKDNVKLSDLVDDLNDSFEYYMKTDSDTEDLVEVPYGDSWDIRQAVGKINKMHDEYLSKGDQSELSFSVEDISLGPKTARSLQVPVQTDAGEESELSDREPELNEALLQRVKEPPQQYTIDAQGNKVPITDARRDSGYDMLV